MKKYSTAEIKKMIIKEAQRQGINPNIMLAIARHESGFDNLAISPKNTDGSRDHGVFQLNDKYHHLNNVYDPQENIAYATKFFKGLLAGAKGNLNKALSNYNVGAGAKGKARQQGDNYAKAVLKIANNYAEDNKIALSTGGASNTSNNNFNIGASQAMQQNISLPDLSTPYVTKDELNRRYAALLSNPQLQQLQQQATGNRQQQVDNVLSQYLSTNSLSYEDTIKALATLGVPEDQLKQIPYKDINRDTQTRLNMLQGTIGTPEDQRLAQQQQFEALQKLQAGQNQGVNMYDLFNNLYDQYRQDSQMPTGYYLDPADLQRQINYNYFSNVLNKRYDQVYTPQQRAEMQYQAQIANQMGMPYETYLAQKANQIALDKEKIENMLKVQTANGTVDQKTLEAYNTVINAGKDLQKEVLTQAGGILKQAESNQGDIAKQIVSNQGNLATTGMTQAGNISGDLMTNMVNLWGQSTDLEKAQIAARLGLTTAQLDNQIKAYQTDVGANVSLRGQDVDRQTELDKIKANEPKNAAQAAYYASGAVANQRFADPSISTSGAVNALPQSVRNNLVNPNLTPEQYNALINPQNAQPNTNAFQNFMNQFNRSEGEQ